MKAVAKTPRRTIGAVRFYDGGVLRADRIGQVERLTVAGQRFRFVSGIGKVPNRCRIGIGQVAFWPNRLGVVVVVLGSVSFAGSIRPTIAG